MNPVIYDEYINTKIEKINFDTVFEEVQKIAGHKAMISVLDLCCGTGILPRKYLIELPNIKYVGVDTNKSFLEFAKSKLTDKNFTFLLHDAATVDVGQKFDLVIATSSYHHIRDEHKLTFLNNIAKHLQNDGHFIIYEKFVAKFDNAVEAVRSGTEFYLERITDMMKHERLNDNQIFALFNELYLTSIRTEEYKVPYEYFTKNLSDTNLKIIDEKKLWPKNKVFNDDKVGDFVIIMQKTRKLE
jgi:SAM-dependent methyltransferase